MSETHAEITARATKAGRAAADFDRVYGADETHHQQAMRRKQNELRPNVWSDAFLAAYAEAQAGAFSAAINQAV